MTSGDVGDGRRSSCPGWFSSRLGRRDDEERPVVERDVASSCSWRSGSPSCRPSVSPSTWAAVHRLTKPHRAVQHTDDGLAGIARGCGFTTVETFHRAFRRQVGITPIDYRNRFTTRPAPEVATAPNDIA
jgi:hypothetical protein